MTVLLVLFTLITFLVCDHFVQRHRARLAQTASEGTDRVRVESFINFPQDVSLATNHMWFANNPDGTTTIGVDALVSRLVGVVEKVLLPRPGDRDVPPVACIGLQSRGRALQLATPFKGDVVETNSQVLLDPSLLLRDPYGKGWLMRVRAHGDSTVTTRDFFVNRPVEWLNEQVALVRDFLAMNSRPAQALVLQEGGLPAEGALQQFDENVWESFGQSFTSLKETRSEEVRS